MTRRPPFRFDLGDGDDTLHIDIANVDGTPALNPLPLYTRFQSSLTFLGRAGADNVSLGNAVTGTGVWPWATRSACSVGPTTTRLACGQPDLSATGICKPLLKISNSGTTCD